MTTLTDELWLEIFTTCDLRVLITISDCGNKIHRDYIKWFYCVNKDLD